MIRIASALLVLGMSAGSAACSAATRDDLAAAPRHTVRVPHDAGVATEVSAASLTLDGRRRYDLSPTLQAFSTYTGESLPVRQQQGRYVHVGLKKATVQWLSVIGNVLPISGGTAVAYGGRVVKVDDRRLTFADGTVLEAEPGLTLSPGSAYVQVFVDPITGRARQVEHP